MMSDKYFGLEYQILRLERDILYKRYINCVEYKSYEKELNILKNMTEEEYNKESEKKKKEWKEIFNEIELDKLKENKIEKYSEFIKNSKNIY